MRIISQYGEMNIPYENTVFFVSDNKVMAKRNNDKYQIGVYKDEQEAMRVLNQMTVLEGHSSYFKLPVIETNEGCGWVD